MKRIIDKIVLLAGAVAFMFWKLYSTQVIIGLFLCVGLSCIYEYTREKRVLWIGYTAFFVGALIFPPVGIWILVLLYDVLYEENVALLACGIGVCISACIRYGWSAVVCFLLLLGIGIVLSYATKKYQQLEIQYKRQRDDSRELELVLKNKNRHLIEKQDYEIHLATLQERNRIAREIHDNVGHLLSRSLLQAGALRAINKQEVLIEPMEAVSKTLNQAMDSIRTSVHKLHEESLDLRSSVDKILEEYSGYNFHFTYELSEGLSKELNYCFLTIIKEALVNVIKHSNADEVQIVMKSFTNLHQLSFRDNGTVTDVNTSQGIGLENMKERVRALGGHIRINNQSGFQIFITIPK